MTKIIVQIIWLMALFLWPKTGNSQDSRGAIAKSSKTNIDGNKYALIIGISDYNEASLNLKFAKNDAALFKDYLAKVENIPDENIKYLIDKEATSLAISIEMEELFNIAKEGDVIYLYFAGHGDVVKKYNKNTGFLLAWDTDTSQNYYGKSGAVPLSEFNNLIAALAEKGVKTILILDACRSGFLFEEGSKENLETIKAMFQNTTSFLSCGPNQLSFEAPNLQHGYFTYYLVLGLMGAADQTLVDNNIQFFELELFLKENVKGETNGEQVPEIRNQSAATDIYKLVNPKDKSEALEIIKNSGKIDNILASRGITISKNEIESHKENAIIEQFNDAIDNNNYEGQPDSAYTLYKFAVNDESLNKKILKKMKFSLLKVFSTSATILINEYIGGAEFLPPSSEFTQQAKYLEIVLELIGNESPSYKNNILTSKLFLESYSVIRRGNYSNFPIAKNKLKKALKLEPRAAYVHNALGILYRKSKQYDSAYYHYNMANKIIPNWTYPITNIGANFHEQYQYNKAKTYYEKSIQLEGSKSSALANLGSFYQRSGNYLLAEKYYKKSLKIDSTDRWVLFKMGDLYSEKGNKEVAKKWYTKIPKKNVYSFNRVLDYIYVMDIENKEAERILKKFIDKEPKYSEAYQQFADYNRVIYYNSNEENERTKTYKLANQLYSKAIELDQNNTWAYYGNALLLTNYNSDPKALSLLEKSIQNNPNDPLSYYYCAQFLSENVNVYNYEVYGFKGEGELIDKIEELYLLAIDKNKYFLPAYNNLSKGSNKKESLNLINNLLIENPQMPELWDILGITYIEMKNFSKAEEAYSQLLSLDNTYAKAFENIAYTKFMLGQLKEAETFYSKAKKANPERFKTFGWDGYSISGNLTPIAEENFKAGDLERAKEIYVLINKLDGNSDISLDLAMVNYLLGNTKSSLKNITELYENPIFKEDNYFNQGTDFICLELLMKTAIDINDSANAQKYFKQLSENIYAPSKLLQLLYYRYMNDTKSSEKVLSTIHPLMLSTKYLNLRYSQNAIKLLLDN